MLVFASEFPLKQPCSRTNIMDVCREWLVQSPHYPWSAANSIEWKENDIVQSSIDGQTLELGLFIDAELELTGLRHSWIENDRRVWTTEIASIQKLDYRWLSVKVHSEDLQPGLLPPIPKKPYILKQLFIRVGGGTDGDFTVQDRPHFLRSDDIQKAIKIITGESQADLPILYISSDFNGHPLVDVDKVAKWLSGIAHVVVEPNRQFSVKLSQTVNNSNPYGGAVAIYWPGSNGKSYRLVPNKYKSSRDLILEAQNILRTSWLYVKGENDCCWTDICEKISSNKIRLLKLSKDTSIEEYSIAFDIENKILKDKIKDLESRRNAAQYSLQNIQTTKSTDGPIGLVSGKEIELYQGEIADCVLSTLIESIGKLNCNARRYAVIEDIIEHNKISFLREHVETEIKRILSKTTRITSSEVAALRDLGFTVEDGGKHYKACFNGDPRYSFTLFKTASDHRAGSNLASDIIKCLFKP